MNHVRHPDSSDPGTPAGTHAGTRRPPRRSRARETLSPTHRRIHRRIRRIRGARGSATPRRSRPQSRPRSRPPTPATVWTVDPSGATDLTTGLTAVWPLPVVDTVVASFSQPGDQVVLIPPPPDTSVAPPDTTTEPGPTLREGTLVTDSPTDGPADADLAAGMDRVVEAVHRAGRTVSLGPPHTPASAGEPSVPREPLPYWADIFHTPHTTTADITDTADTATAGGRPVGREHQPEHRPTADLVIASVTPNTPLDDHCGLAWAALLRTGGILAVLTHSDWTADWTRGRLIDPTGPVVAAAQNADLLYLQHIVAVHAPVRDGTFAINTTDITTGRTTGRTTDSTSDSTSDTTLDSALDQRRSEHRAQARGLPTPHRRIHTDVLVFAQPGSGKHGHDSAPSSPANAAFTTGVIG